MGNTTGKMVIFSAPSGAGKSTLVQYLIPRFPQLSFSISATSRPPRGEEKEGREYYFLTSSEFLQRAKSNQFLEWEEVYKDTYYGTLVVLTIKGQVMNPEVQKSTPTKEGGSVIAK